MEGHRLGVLLWICVCVLDGVAATCPSGTYGYMCSYQCHCPPDKCHTTFGCQSANCFLGWSGPTCEKENIAFNKSTTSSDGYPYPSSNAVDGDTKRNDDTKCILSAYNDASITSAWWRVDLGQKTLIHDVIIYFRTGYIVRRNGIQIYIADTAASPTDGVNCYNVTGNRDGTDISDVLNVTCSGEGRYLVLYTTTVNNEINNVNVPVLDFCEVEVDATCPSGKYGYMCSYQCHCPPDKCHTTFGCQSANCFLGWSGPTCEKENIAFNKSTTSSDGYPYPSSNAVDGDTKRNDDTKCILSAYNDASITSAWWRVDLGQKTLIHDVIIYFRTGYIVRRNGIQIYIADTAASLTDGVNCYNVTGNRNGTDIPDVLNVTCSGEGRYLVLYTTTVNNEINNVNVPVLDFCEVEVDVCDDGSYGTNCTQTCSNRNCKGDNSICDHVTGKCDEGCMAGWNGTDCTHECVNSYGESCAHLCSSRNCSGSSSCNHVTGQCENGCIPGWKDTDCREVCDFGSYGTNCTQTCSNRNCKGDNSSCDHVAGECVGGCTAGWNGTDCTHVCDDGSYGTNCTQTCSNRNCKGDNSICDHVTGKCDEGCMAGWNGTDCTHVCDDGSYGTNCTQTCSNRNCKGDNSSCDHVAGECVGGCTAGWNGTDCTHVCDDGSYGTNCTQTCSNRNCRGDNSICDHVTGKCEEGCIAGWNGTDCTHECVNPYGEGCAYLCSSRKCSGTALCNHVTGQCENGCISGWKNTDCRESMSMPSPQNTGAIVGSIVAVIAVAAIIVVVIVLRRRRSHSKHENDADMFEIQKVGGTQSKGVDNPMDNDVGVEGEADNDVEEDHNDTYYNIARALPVTVVSVDQLGERIQELQVPVGGFQAEYQKLSNTFTRPYNDSQLEENKGKNKYISYYPYDATRVVLTELPGRPGSDYINASYIHGYSRPKAYIAAQAPTTMTLPDFWRMIWEQNCTRIVMLTNLMELGRVKCEAYWCDTSDMNAGDLTVTVTNSSIRAHWVVRELQVADSKTNTRRCFHHFHFTTWPDHGTPEETALTEFLWLVRTSYNTQDDPLLVHCSAGVGRTGTYIAVDYLLDQALADQKVDVFGCISGMRDQRKGLIQTKEQYRCVYMALFETLKFGNTSISAEEFRSSRRVRGVFNIGRMAINKLIKTLNTQREELSKGTPDKGRVWIDGRSDILSVMSRSHLSVKGYLLTEAPSVTTASLFWKLTGEQESSTVIVLPDSHQSLSNFVPCPGDSLDLDHVSVRCSTETTINRDITLLKIQRQVKNSPPTVVRVYILNILPAESPSTFLELLEQVDRHTGNVNPHAVTVLYSDGGKQNGAMLCIMSNIIQGVKHDKRVEIYNNMRAMTHCLDQDITQTDVALCYDMASAYIESQNIYANM
ncbi:uncharacterized protein LOC124125702 isoform X3 [Haliotis rufescens]|uniref:uncharacterized protein LOC124125702 isoform X3 n=1 Tax=Haliotis rufescens TaxID=6454 RepID=UPI00201ED51B|nr:uncharacterized protein LOC124125702 isoform X3 [Haliotis rufescens]